MRDVSLNANSFFGTDAIRLIGFKGSVQGTAFAQNIIKKLEMLPNDGNIMRLSKDGGYSIYVARSGDMKRILGSVQASAVLPEKDKTVLAVARAIVEVDKLGARDLLLLAKTFEGFVPADCIGSDLVGTVKMTINNNGKNTQALVQANLVFVMEQASDAGKITYQERTMTDVASIPINDDLIGTFNEIYMLELPATRRMEAFNKHENGA